MNNKMSIKQLFSAVVKAYSQFGRVSDAANAVQENRPDMTYQQAYDLAYDILFEFVS